MWAWRCGASTRVSSLGTRPPRVVILSRDRTDVNASEHPAVRSCAIFLTSRPQEPDNPDEPCRFLLDHVVQQHRRRTHGVPPLWRPAAHRAPCDGVASAALALGSIGVAAQDNATTIGSNYSDPVPKAAMQAVFDYCQEQEGITLTVNTTEHNAFQEQLNSYLQGDAGRHLHLVRRVPDAVLRRPGPRDARSATSGPRSATTTRRRSRRPPRATTASSTSSRSTTTRGSSSTARASSRRRATRSRRTGTSSRRSPTR